MDAKNLKQEEETQRRLECHKYKLEEERLKRKED
jgi:hypothetical protein